MKERLLPEKAKPKNETQIYWIEPANHKNFDVLHVQSREIFLQCMDTVLKLYDNMRLLKIKEYWNKSDSDLVFNNRFTKEGLITYWRAMDATFKFNVLKRRDYLIRNSFRLLKTKMSTEDSHSKQKFSAMKRKPVSENNIKDDCRSNSAPTVPAGKPLVPKFQMSMNNLFEDMQEFFHRHETWRQNHRSSFDRFHDSFFNSKL